MAKRIWDLGALTCEDGLGHDDSGERMTGDRCGHVLVGGGADVASQRQKNTAQTTPEGQENGEHMEELHFAVDASSCGVLV